MPLEVVLYFLLTAGDGPKLCLMAVAVDGSFKLVPARIILTSFILFNFLRVATDVPAFFAIALKVSPALIFYFFIPGPLGEKGSVDTSTFLILILLLILFH